MHYTRPLFEFMERIKGGERLAVVFSPLEQLVSVFYIGASCSRAAENEQKKITTTIQHTPSLESKLFYGDLL